MTRPRHVHVEHIWGTVVSIDVPLLRYSMADAQFGVAAVVRWLHKVDATFSTFRPDSEVSRLRSGGITVDQCGEDLSDVVARCQRMYRLTHGRFDPWSVSGGFDPSGLVKGWAADRAADILAARGMTDCMINAGGDITVRGEPEPGRSWSVGLQHPESPGEIHGSIAVTDCAVATSGRYERGDHITSPRGVNAVSATVVGPDGATADALATALLIEGVPGLAWLTRLPAYSAQVVVEGEVTSTGAAFVSHVG